MFCPECRTEYGKGFTRCADCEVALVDELSPEPPAPPEPEYVRYVHLYSPQNDVELSILRSVPDSESIDYFIRNDNFGSLEVGPRIGLFNAKMIDVRDDQYERAKELLADYLNKTRSAAPEPAGEYSWFDKVRMVIEALVFGWFMPGRTKRKKTD